MRSQLLVVQNNPLRAPSTWASLFEFEFTHTEASLVFVGGLVGRFEACVCITSQSAVPLRELVFGSALCWVQGVVCQLEWYQLLSNYKGCVTVPISRAHRLHPSQHGKSAHHPGSDPPLQHACTVPHAPQYSVQQYTLLHTSAWHISARYGRNVSAQIATNARQFPQSHAAKYLVELMTVSSM